MGRRRGLLTGLALAALATSCGWHAGLSPPPDGGPPLAGEPSVGVEVFDVQRDVLERDLEPILHTELTRAVTELVDAPLASPREATLVLRGEILEYRRRSGIRSTENRLLETAVRIRVRAELVRRATGQRVGEAIERQVWSGTPLDRAGDEGRARERALRHIAQTLVLDLFRPLPALERPDAGVAPPSGSPSGARTDPGGGIR